MLIEAVAVVAAAPTAQVAWLERYEVPPDEIALNFDDVFRSAARLAEVGRLSPAVLPQLRMIHAVFAEMSQDADAERWSRGALATDRGWDRARRLAREVLAAEDEREAPLPDIRVIR